MSRGSYLCVTPKEMLLNIPYQDDSGDVLVVKFEANKPGIAIMQKDDLIVVGKEYLKSLIEILEDVQEIIKKQNEDAAEKRNMIRETNNEKIYSNFSHLPTEK